MRPSAFSELTERYRAFFFDAYGVLRDSSGLLPGAARVLRSLERRGKPFWILTNDASQTPAAMAATYRDDAGGLVGEGRVIGSGQLLAEHLSLRPGAPVCFLGTPASEHYLRLGGARVVPIPDGPDAVEPVAFVLTDEAGFDWRVDLNRVVNALRTRPHVELLAPNPDLVYHASRQSVGIAAGALATMLEAVLGRPCLRFGKPDRSIFLHALQRARREVEGLEPSQVLMVGDNLETDARGALETGIDVLLVLTGNTSPELLESESRRLRVRPTYVADSLAADCD